MPAVIADRAPCHIPQTPISVHSHRMFPATAMADAHLLLVDSDPRSLDTLVGHFQGESGIVVHTVANPADAWAIL